MIVGLVVVLVGSLLLSCWVGARLRRAGDSSPPAGPRRAPTDPSGARPLASHDGR